MAYTIKQDIVVPYMYVYNASQLQPGFHQIHLHSTGNPNSTVQNERDYLSRNYSSANYTHLVGITNGAVDIRQVMNTNGGAWDVGGDWNWETYAAIEFVEGSIQSQSDFNKAYPAYIWLARELARQAGIPYTIDKSNNSGIKTHNYASATGHGSDHVDPIAFLAKWGVSRNQLYKDIISGVDEVANAKYKVGDRIVLAGNAWASTYNTRYPGKVKKQIGTIKSVKRYDRSNSHWSYEVQFDELWNVLEQDIVAYSYPELKQGTKVKLIPNAWASTYNTRFDDKVKGAWGKVAFSQPFNKSSSKRSYAVAFYYDNDITIWNVLEQDLNVIK